jgi:dsRNA-specific ribonuclease
MSSKRNDTSDISDIKNMNLWFKNGDFKNHIINEKNIPITQKFIESIFKKYNFKHKVVNLDVFQLAMIHVSYLEKTNIPEKTARLLKDVIPISDSDRKIAMPLKTKDYGRLEFLGDAKLSDVLARYLYDRYENDDEGFLTKLRIELEKDETLSKISKKLGLEKYAIVARNIEQGGGRQNNVHLTEDIFEAFIGALSLECSHEDCEKFIISIIETDIDIADLISTDNNYKHRLMTFFHKMKWGEPKYHEDISQRKNTKEGCVEIRSYTTYIKNPSDSIIGVGDGNSKQKSEKNAAYNALITLGDIKEDASSDDSDYYGELDDADSDSDSDYFEM